MSGKRPQDCKYRVCSAYQIHIERLREPLEHELFAASPNEEAFHSSSIVKVEKRPEMATFHFGAAGGMLGPMPDMTKSD